MLWVGALVAIIAVMVGRRYRDTGLWLNLVLAGCRSRLDLRPAPAGLHAAQAPSLLTTW
jgi:hypothetical protein